MRITATLSTLLLALTAIAGGHAPVAAQDEAGEAGGVSVSAICAYQLSTAAGQKEAAITAAAGPDADTTEITPETAEAVAAALPVDWLDLAIRSCSSLDDWLAAHQLFPDVLAATDATDFLHDRCRDAAAGLEPYATCRSVVTALATPAPVAEPDATPTPVDPAIEPVDVGTDPEPVVDTQEVDTPEQSTGKSRKGKKKRPKRPIASVTKDFKARIPGATQIRYFTIRGNTPFKLLLQNQEKSRPHCRTHQAIACVIMHWSIDVDKAYDKQTRRCSMKNVRTKLVSTVYLPRWANRAGADPALVKWWRKVLLESAIHEAEHIVIQKQHLADFRAEARGKSCGAATFFYNQHAAKANLAQADFDEIEYQKPLPPIPESLLR